MKDICHTCLTSVTAPRIYTPAPERTEMCTHTHNLPISKVCTIIGFQLLSEPDHFDSQKCGAINKGDTQWSSAPCGNSKGFLCRFKSSKHFFVFNFSLNYQT